MHLGRFLVSTVLFLLPSVHASIGQVNAANQALAAEAAKYDGNVNNLNNANGFANGPGIVNDLASLNGALVSSTQNAQGTAATSDRPTEQSVVDSFTAFCNALATYMQDLAAKVEPLYFENQNIIDALEDLDSNFFNYSQSIEDLVNGMAYKDGVDNAAENAEEKINVAQDAFEAGKEDPIFKRE